MAKQTFTTGQVLTAAQMTSLQQTAMLGGAASAKTASFTLVAADAGTAISMNSASATTITVNTSLFAAGDTVHITNLGAGVCTITAGTATVNTSATLTLAQYESGFLDFTTASAAIFVKGAGAGGSTSGLILLNTTSFSAVASQLVDNVFSSTYDNYYIALNCTSSARTNMIFYLRASSTDTTTAYERQSITGNSTTISGNRASDSEFAVVNSTGINSMDLTLFSPNIAQRTTAFTRSLRDDSGLVLFNFSVQQTAATQFTGIKFLTGSGTMTGSLSIYGMSK